MSPSRLRVSVQLIDAVNDRNVWADNYDRPTGDLFELQDEITQAITGVLIPELNSAERKRSLRDNRPALDAWMAYQKGLAHYYQPYSDSDHAEAKRQFDRSIALDPSFADAHAMVSLMGTYAISSGQSTFTGSPEDILSEAKRAAERAVLNDDGNALAHVALGRAYMMHGQLEPGVAEGETAVKLNPNFALAYHELGFTLSHIGRLEESIQCFEQAIRLSPNDPSRWNFFLLKGISQFGLGKNDLAVANLEEASRLRPDAFWPFLALATAYVGLDQMDDARAAVREVLIRKPDWKVSNMVRIFGTARSDHTTKWVNNLRHAGLPEE
jgi:tetratricopeptide (TPR) repeat protein